MTATDQPVDTDHDGHVSDWVYIKTALWLGFFTAVEVFTYFESVHKMPDWLLILILCTLMVVKFFLVAAIFMHLKYDNAVFTKFIVAGLIVAYPVYMVMGYAMDWWPDPHWVVKVLTVAVPPTIAAVWLLGAWQGGDDEAHA